MRVVHMSKDEALEIFNGFDLKDGNLRKNKGFARLLNFMFELGFNPQWRPVNAADNEKEYYSEGEWIAPIPR